MDAPLKVYGQHDGSGYEWGTHDQSCGTCGGDGYCPEC